MTERPSAPRTRLDPNDQNKRNERNERNDPGGLNDRARYWAFRVLGALAPLAPLWLAQRIAVTAGALLWLCAGGLRQRAARNLGHIPALAADPARLRAATRGVFINLALNYLDFFRGRVVTYEELARGWQITGWELFEQAMRSGRGAIIMGAHLGPFEYAAWKLGELGYPLLTPAERLRPERFNQLVARLRNHHHARLLPGDDRETLRELLGALRNGQLAMFAVDRWVMGPRDAWPLFGQPARLPTAPFALAARSEAPVFLLVPWRRGLNRYGGSVELITPERLRPATSADSEDSEDERGTDGAARGRDREAAIARMRQRLYPALERAISEHPEQWVSALSPVWDAQDPQRSPDGHGAAGARPGRSRAAATEATTEEAREVTPEAMRPAIVSGARSALPGGNARADSAVNRTPYAHGATSERRARKASGATRRPHGQIGQSELGATAYRPRPV